MLTEALGAFLDIGDIESTSSERRSRIAKKVGFRHTVLSSKSTAPALTAAGLTASRFAWLKSASARSISPVALYALPRACSESIVGIESDRLAKSAMGTVVIALDVIGAAAAL